MWNKTLNALKVIIIHPWLQIAFSCTYDGGHFSKGPCYNSIAKLGGQYIVSLSNWWALWNLTMLIHLLLSGDFREASLSKFLLLWMGNGLRTEPIVWVIHIEDFFNVLFEFWEFSGQVHNVPKGRMWWQEIAFLPLPILTSDNLEFSSSYWSHPWVNVNGWKRFLGSFLWREQLFQFIAISR